jgi:hypothetical protein
MENGNKQDRGSRPLANAKRQIEPETETKGINDKHA